MSDLLQTTYLKTPFIGQSRTVRKSVMSVIRAYMLSLPRDTKEKTAKKRFWFVEFEY